jgi:hypothetical protein
MTHFLGQGRALKKNCFTGALDAGNTQCCPGFSTAAYYVPGILLYQGKSCAGKEKRINSTLCAGKYVTRQHHIRIYGGFCVANYMPGMLRHPYAHLI